MGETGWFIVMFSGIWCLVGIIFLCVGIGLTRSFNRKEERLRARASGTVTEIVRRASGDSASFYPIVAFDYEGRRIELESTSGGGRRRYYEGQAVEVLYDPDDPACFRLENDGSGRLVGRVMLAVGLGCVAIGVIAAVVIAATSPSIRITSKIGI